MKKILSELGVLESALKKKSALQLSRFEFFDSPANLGQLDELKASGKIEKTVLDFYRVSDGFAIEWEPVDPLLLKNDIVGRVKINPFQQVVRSWKAVVYFDDEPENTPRRKFFPLDFFADEASVGFCSLEGYRNELYLFKFEGDLIPLSVTFESYLKLLLLTKGCYYWQYLVLEILEGEENLVSQRIKEHLPSLFPDFSFKAFSTLFNQLRIR